MATDVLQAFLSKRLFDVGGDDGRVKALRNAADDLPLSFSSTWS